MKRENIFWGLFFILAALFMLVGRLDFFEGLSFFKIFGTLLLVGWLGHSLSKRDYGGILFSIAFLCILYDEFLGIEELTPWPVLGAAMFGSIGLSMHRPAPPAPPRWRKACGSAGSLPGAGHHGCPPAATGGKRPAGRSRPPVPPGPPAERRRHP